jgi:hypothetical protein
LEYKDENIQNYNFACCFVLLWNLSSRPEGVTQAEGVEVCSSEVDSGNKEGELETA